MSTLCAIRAADGAIWTASDSRATAGGKILTDQEPGKWLYSEDGRCAFGIAGAYRALALARRAGIVYGDSAQEIAERLLAELRQDGWSSSESGKMCFEINALIAAPDGLFFMTSDFALDAISYGAIGSGDTWAEGALAAFTGLGVAPEEAVRKSILIAIARDYKSGGAVNVRCVGEPPSVLKAV